MEATIRRVMMVSFVLLGLVSGRARAGDVKGEMERLLELGNSARTRLDAQEQFERLLTMTGYDARVYYAYAMIQIKNRQYRQAAGLIDAVVRLDPENLPAQETKIWLDVVTAQYGEALAAMERVAAVLTADGSSRPEAKAACEAAGFLGQVCSFLDGPAAEKVDRQAVAACQGRILARLTPEMRAAYDEGYGALENRYTSMAENIGGLRQSAKKEEEHLKERQRKHLDDERQYVAGELAQQEDRRAEVRREGIEERSQIAQSEGAVLQSLGQAGAAANQALQNYASLDGAIGVNRTLGSTPFPESEPVLPNNATPSQMNEYNDAYARWQQRKQQWEQQQQASSDYADQWEPYRQGQAVAAGNLGGQAAGLQAELGLQHARYLDSEARQAAELERLERREHSLHVRNSRIARDEKRIAKRPVVGNNPQVMALRAKIATLTTYVSVPVSVKDEMQRVLDSFDATALAASSQ